jgi:hypothetical protein
MIQDYLDGMWGYIFLWIYATICALQLGGLDYLWLIPVIVLASPFIEYIVHTRVLHFPRSRTSERVNKFLDDIHHEHHRRPSDLDHVFGDVRLVAGTLLVTFIPALLVSTGCAFMLAWVLLTYYLIYEWFHLTAHTGRVPKTRYGKYMKKYHLRHHFQNDSYWYGITSPIGDMVFGKFANPTVVPRRIPMMLSFHYLEGKDE